MFSFTTNIGIDLGTANVLVYIKGKGVVLQEPSVVAYDRDTSKIKAIGEEARHRCGASFEAGRYFRLLRNRAYDQILHPEVYR